MGGQRKVIYAYNIMSNKSHLTPNQFEDENWTLEDIPSVFISWEYFNRNYTGWSWTKESNRNKYMEAIWGHNWKKLLEDERREFPQIDERRKYEAWMAEHPNYKPSSHIKKWLSGGSKNNNLTPMYMKHNDKIAHIHEFLSMMGKRPEHHSVGDYSKLEGMGLHHLPLHHHHRRVGGAIVMGDPQHYLTSPAHQSTHWRNTAPMSYSHIVEGGRHRPPSAMRKRTGGAINDAYRKELQDYVFDEIQKIRKPTSLDYFAFRPDYRQYIMERITPEIDKFLAGYYGFQMGLKTRFKSSKIYTDLMDYIIPVLESKWPTMANNEEDLKNGMISNGPSNNQINNFQNYAHPHADPNSHLNRPSGRGRHRPLLRKRRGGAIISGGVPSVETGFESPMSYAHLSGGMINPMKPDGTMMTKKEIKMVQLRNKLMNRPKKRSGGVIPIGLGYDSDSGSDSDSDRGLPSRRRGRRGAGFWGSVSNGLNSMSLIPIPTLPPKGGGRGKLGIGGKHLLHAHHQSYLAKYPTTKFKTIEAFAKKFGKGLGCYC